MATSLNTEDNLFLSVIKDATDTLEGADKYKFYRAATEAVITQKDLSARTAVLSSLYRDIQIKSLIDFDQIPLSRGDFSKYKYFELSTKVLDNLNAIYKDLPKFEEVEIMNKLYNSLLALAPDFKYGFMHDIDLIKLQYNTLVLALHEIQNICILAYLKYIANIKATSVSFGDYKQKQLLVLRGAKEFIQCYESGEWNKVMKSIKAGAMSGATEGIGELASNRNPEIIYNVITKLSETAGKVTGSGIFKAGKYVALGLSVFLLLRCLVFYFYNKAAKVSDTLKIQVQFIDALKENPEGLNPKTARRADKLVNLANSVVGIIDGKIFKANNTASKDLRVSDNAVAASVQTQLDAPQIQVEDMPPRPHGGHRTDNDFQLM